MTHFLKTRQKSHTSVVDFEVQLFTNVKYIVKKGKSLRSQEVSKRQEKVDRKNFCFKRFTQLFILLDLKHGPVWIEILGARMFSKHFSAYLHSRKNQGITTPEKPRPISILPCVEVGLFIKPFEFVSYKLCQFILDYFLPGSIISNCLTSFLGSHGFR